MSKIFRATWQRCRVHFIRSLLAYVPKSQQTVVSAAIRQVFVQPNRKAAGEAWRHVADQRRPRFPKVAALLDDAEHDVLAYMDYPEPHRSKLYSTNPIERLNKEVKRCTSTTAGTFRLEPISPRKFNHLAKSPWFCLFAQAIDIVGLLERSRL